MIFINEHEIEDAAIRFRQHPVLGPATLFLRNFADEVNRHSDGWPYWSPPVKAAAKLITLINSHLYAGMGAYPRLPEPTLADVQKTLAPIKAFMTRRGIAAGMTLPTLISK